MNIRQDTILGSFFIVVGGTALLMALQYSFGTTARMGPGYFPVVISGLLTLTGVAILLRGRLGETALIENGRWKPLAIVLASIVIFGLLVERLGLPVSVFILIVVAALGSAKFSLSWRAAAAAAAFSAICGVLFVRLLGIPIPMFGTWFQALGL